MNMHYYMEPRRGLHANFTQHTLQRAMAARKRLLYRHYIKGLFAGMTSYAKRPIAAILGVAAISLGPVGVYATANWFQGDVAVRSDGSVLHIDLSQCRGPLPPGIDGRDRTNVQFRVVGEPSIGAASLQEKLLAGCEFEAVIDFYAQHGQSAQPATVRAINPSAQTISLEYYTTSTPTRKTFALLDNTAILNKGRPAAIKALKVGDSVMAVHTGSGQPFVEGQDPLANITSIESIFKTQYDLRQAPQSTKNFYEQNNIMPLDWYNHINQN